jgi:acyl carrier protein
MNELISEVCTLVENILRESQHQSGPMPPVRPANSLFADYGINSLAMVSLIMSIEQRFDVSFSDDELLSEHFESVETIVALLESKRCALEPRDGAC